jgi:cell division protein FtsB
MNKWLQLSETQKIEKLHEKLVALSKKCAILEKEVKTFKKKLN